MLFSSLGPETLFLSHNQVLWFSGFGDHLAVAGGYFISLPLGANLLDILEAVEFSHQG